MNRVVREWRVETQTETGKTELHALHFAGTSTVSQDTRDGGAQNVVRHNAYKGNVRRNKRKCGAKNDCPMMNVRTMGTPDL